MPNCKIGFIPIKGAKGVYLGTMTLPSMGMLQWEDLSLLWTKSPAKTTHQLCKMLFKQKDHLALKGKDLIKSYFILHAFSFFLIDINSYQVNQHLKVQLLCLLNSGS